MQNLFKTYKQSNFINGEPINQIFEANKNTKYLHLNNK